MNDDKEKGTKNRLKICSGGWAAVAALLRFE